jgi:two-component system response regulator NreC
MGSSLPRATGDFIRCWGTPGGDKLDYMLPLLDMPSQVHNRRASTQADTAEIVDSEEAIRIVLADDRDVMRAELRLMLGGETDLEVVAEAPDVSTVLRRVNGFLSQVLVLDLGMPGPSSIEMLQRLHRQLPGTRIVVRSASDDPIFARRALDAGATSVVVNGAADVELPQVVRCAAHGERYVSPSTDMGIAALQDAPSATRLTPRELEVLQLIALGYTSVEVADKLDLSPRTIETHRARIHRKLKVATRAGLVSYALARGLVKNGVAAEA